MSTIDAIKALIPDYAKDIRLNVEAVLSRSSLTPADALGCALAAAFATRTPQLTQALKAAMEPADAQAALTAAALMGMNNVWYPYVEMADDPELKQQRAELRMQAYTTHGGVAKARFEAFALSASIVGKCHFCVASHYATLKKEGWSAVQVRDVGRIAAVINAASQCISENSNA